MRSLLKSIFSHSPLFIRVFLLRAREFYYRILSLRMEKKEYPYLRKNNSQRKEMKNILVYHISGMYYAGTEKNLRLIANGLTNDYNVFYMYSSKNFLQKEKDSMDPRVHLLEFSYSEASTQFPYFIHGMNPHIKNVIADNAIDLLVVSDAGHSQYPFNTIQDIPIIFINIFGSPMLQKNVVANLFISKAVLDYSEYFTGKQSVNTYNYLTIAPPEKNYTEEKSPLRDKLGIPKEDFVFGRIGRNADSIFDPIGIEAFKRVVKKNKHVHYCIMSPPPILEKIVKEENIPNIHYIDVKENIWDFYYSLDALAHFRRDGETFGLNIAEAMYAGNPIISHVSHIWNAHLEYLLPSFSRVADKDSVEQYASFMEEFITLKENEPTVWQHMKEEARSVAVKRFNKEDYVQNIQSIVCSLYKK